MSDLKPQTQAIRTQVERSQHKEHAVPVYLTSSFVYDDAEEMRATFAAELDRNIYSRFSNPNVAELAEKIALLEGADAGHAVASGMAAVFGTFGALLSSGDHIVSCRSVFGSTHRILNGILPRWGIQHTYVDVDDPDGWERAITPNTKMLYVETPTNPAVDIVDLQFLSRIADHHDVLLVVDNCFATPILQQPIALGAHLSIHSATKFIDGQGRVIGGVLAGRQDLVDDIYAFCRATGPALSAFDAWVLSKSVETLGLRMERHSENALSLSQWLESRADVTDLRYPYLPSHPRHDIALKQMSGGGAVLSFSVEGGLERGRAFLDALQLCSLTANLGDSRTIVTHPASTTHSKLTEEERAAVGISPGLIRISVGLEDIEDVQRDVEQALDRSAS